MFSIEIISVLPAANNDKSPIPLVGNSSRCNVSVSVDGASAACPIEISQGGYAVMSSLNNKIRLAILGTSVGIVRVWIVNEASTIINAAMLPN